MEGLENFSVSENITFGWEKSPEEEKKYTEQAKKTAARIQRVAKDEKKAKRDDNILFDAIVSFLNEENPQYTQQVFYITDLISKEIPTSFVLGIISLLYEPISIKIRENISKKIEDKKSGQEDIFVQNPWFFEYIQGNSLKKSQQVYKKTPQIIGFDDSGLDDSLKNRINEWVNDMVFVFFSDTSFIMLQKLKRILFLQVETEEEEEIKTKQIEIQKIQLKLIQKTIEHTFFLFLQRENILIAPSKAGAYGSFIFSQVQKNILQIQFETID